MLDQLLSDFKNNLPQFLNSGCIVNGTVVELETIEKMGYEEFSYQCRRSMPKKFYRYFPNKDYTSNDGITQNYSIQALKDNTVYLQSPNEFDDVYDSEIFVDYEKGFCLEYSVLSDDKQYQDIYYNLFPITKVFLGNRMALNQRRQIINICNERNIPYVCVTKNPYLFEMQECGKDCGKCFINSKNITSEGVL